LTLSNIKILSSADYGDFVEYDRFVHSQAQGWVTALSSWGKVLEKSFRHIQDKSLVIHENRDNKVVGVIPLCLVKSHLTGRRLVSMPFATLGTPLLPDNFDISTIMPYLEKSLQSCRASRLEIRTSFPGISEKLSGRFTAGSIFKCHQIDLNRPVEQIYQNLHRSYLRRYVNRATDVGAVIRIADKFVDIQSFHHLYSMTRKRLLLPAIPISFFTSIWEIFAPQKNAIFINAEMNGKPAAAIMLLAFGNRVSAEALGWDPSFSKEHIVAGLYWEAIKYAHAKGYSVFDFGRTDPQNTSLMEYKNRWGTTVTDLPVYIYPHVSNKNKTNGKNSQISLLIRKIVFGLPQPLYRAVSNFCYQHMG